MTIDPIAHVVTIPDETGVDQLGTFLDGLLEQSKTSLEAKVHLTFIQQALTLLAHRPLNHLKRDRIKLSITIEQKEYTKEYQLVKPLAKKPIFELRYPMNSNEHFRALFFPLNIRKTDITCLLSHSSKLKFLRKMKQISCAIWRTTCT